MSTWDILILDKSGSMLPNKQNLINGFNNLVNEQKKQGSTNKFTLITFSNVVEAHPEQHFPDVDKMSDIQIKGQTSLIDAIGEAYTLVKNSDHKNVSITIITDGCENSSTKYTRESLDVLKQEISENIQMNITFIGTDENCIKENPINLHITTSIDYRGDLLYAMRSASQSITTTREEIIQELLVPPKRKRTSEDSQHKKKCIDVCSIE